MNLARSLVDLSCNLFDSYKARDINQPLLDVSERETKSLYLLMAKTLWFTRVNILS